MSVYRDVQTKATETNRAYKLDDAGAQGLQQCAPNVPTLAQLVEISGLSQDLVELNIDLLQSIVGRYNNFAGKALISSVKNEELPKPEVCVVSDQIINACHKSALINRQLVSFANQLGYDFSGQEAQASQIGERIAECVESMNSKPTSTSVY